MPLSFFVSNLQTWPDQKEVTISMFDLFNKTDQIQLCTTDSRLTEYNNSQTRL